jgi:hypothetical protein
MKCTNYEAPHDAIIFTITPPPGSKLILLITLFSNTLNLYSYFNLRYQVHTHIKQQLK